MFCLHYEKYQNDILFKSHAHFDFFKTFFSPKNKLFNLQLDYVQLKTK